MGLEPTLRAQEHITEALKRHGERFNARERRAEAIVSGGFVADTTALIALLTPSLRSGSRPRRSRALPR